MSKPAQSQGSVKKRGALELLTLSYFLSLFSFSLSLSLSFPSLISPIYIYISLFYLLSLYLPLSLYIVPLSLISLSQFPFSIPFLFPSSFSPSFSLPISLCFCLSHSSHHSLNCSLSLFLCLSFSKCSTLKLSSEFGLWFLRLSLDPLILSSYTYPHLKK